MLNRRHLHRLALALAAAPALAAWPAHAADEAPDAMIARLSDEALQALRDKLTGGAN